MNRKRMGFQWVKPVPHRPAVVCSRLALVMAVTLSWLAPSLAAGEDRPTTAAPRADLPAAPLRVTIPYARPLADTADLDGFQLDQAGRWLAIQDRGKGILLLADPTTGRIDRHLTLPDGLRNLAFTTAGPVYALASAGIIPFPDLDTLLRFLERPLANPKPAAIPLEGWTAAGPPGRHRLKIDPAGGFLLWDREASDLHIFHQDGKRLSEVPCQGDFLPTGRRTFLSAYYGPGQGSRILEMAYAAPPAPDGSQPDLPGVAIEVGLPDGNEVHLVSFDPRDQSALVVVYPPSLPDLSPPLTEEEADRQLAREAPDFTRDPRYAGFIDPAKPGSPRIMLARVDGAGKVTPLAAFPFITSGGHSLVDGNGVSLLVPVVATDSFRVTALDIFQWADSSASGR